MHAKVLGMVAMIRSLFREGLAEMVRQGASLKARGLRGHVSHELTAWRSIDRSDNAVVRAGQMGRDVVGAVLTITLAAVIGYVGLVIMSDTEDAAEFTNNSNFDNASGDLTGGIETSFGLLEVVFLVIMLVVIIGALVQVRR
jgi:hypothetical protein